MGNNISSFDPSFVPEILMCRDSLGSSEKVWGVCGNLGSFEGIRGLRDFGTLLLIRKSLRRVRGIFPEIELV